MNDIMLIVEGYNIGVTFVIIFLIGQILFMVGRTDEKLLKARIFLSEKTLQDTWLYISIFGASLGVHALSSFLRDMGVGFADILFIASEVVFLTAFMVVMYQWFRLIESIKKSVKNLQT